MKPPQVYESVNLQSEVSDKSTIDQPAPPCGVQALRLEQKEIGTTEPIEIIPAVPVPPITGPPDLDVIKDTLDKDTVQLEWYPDLDSIDSLGMKHEFREDDLDWGINPKLTRKQRRLWTKMLRKHLKIFAGRLARQGVSTQSEQDVSIEAKKSCDQSSAQTVSRQGTTTDDRSYYTVACKGDRRRRCYRSMICSIRCFFIFFFIFSIATVVVNTPPVAGLRRGMIAVLQVILGFYYKI